MRDSYLVPPLILAFFLYFALRRDLPPSSSPHYSEWQIVSLLRVNLIESERCMGSPREGERYLVG